MKIKLPGFMRPRPAFSHAQTLQRLKTLGFVPETIYDIGAFHGEWTKSARKVFPAANFVLFEANPDNAAPLAARGERHVIAVLAENDDEEKRFYLPRHAVATGASLYCEQTEHYAADRLRTETVKTRRLDAVAAELMLPPPDMIKLDVQGAELDVLAGARDLLRPCKVIIAEVSLLSYNDGAPLIADIVAGVAGLGFRCVDVCEVHRTKSGNLLQMDLLFANMLLYEKYRAADGLT